MTGSGGAADQARTALPSGDRMRYWRPAPELAAFVSGYHLYAVAPPPGMRHRDVFQPAWPSLRFAFGEDTRWRVRQPGQDWRPVPARSVFGPSSRVTWSEAGAGIVVGIGLRPRGWARWARVPASDWADRIDRPDDVFQFDVDALHAQVAAADDDAAIPALFDAFLSAHGGPAKSGDTVIGTVEAALLDPEIPSVAALARQIGVSLRTLERLSLKAFGFTPKLLMRRGRFLRSLHAIAEAAVAERATAIDPGYTDYSHFVRDAQLFLGMSPQAFLKLDLPMFRQSLALRRAVLGAPAQALVSDTAG